MPKNKWKVQKRYRRAGRWFNEPHIFATRSEARAYGVAIRGFFGFGNTRVVRVK